MCRKPMSSVITVSVIWIVLLPGPSGSRANAELVAGYSFEGNLDDMSGNGYDGTAYGTVAYDTGPIAHGQCLKLNGTNYVQIPLGAANPIISDANGFTCMSWVNTDASEINVVLASGALLEDNDWFYAVPDGTYVHFDLWYVAGWEGGGLTPGEWYHVAIVYDADSSYTIYLDGEEIGTETFETPIGTADRSSFVVRIGGADNGDYPGAGPLYDGLLDDVCLFNTALTQPEIRDLMNLPPAIGFESAASGAFETISPAELVVIVSDAEATETYTVDYVVTNGDAEGGGVDYTLAPGTLTFDPCDTTETISIDIVNDDEDENDETIVVTLSNPTGTDVQLGEITEHTYTIIDPRPYVEFAKTAGCGLEDVTPATISVTLSHTYFGTVTVNYAVSGGTATGGGVDYTLAAGTLQFDPCQVTQYINIDIVDDPCEESPETIELTLSNPTNAKFGDNTQHTFAICEKIYSLLEGAFYYRLDSGQSWEDVAKVGAYADVKVHLGDEDDKLVFWRGSSYRPCWQTDFGTWYVTEEVQMQGGAGGLRPDEINQYSQVFIIENSPARAVVRWRYAHNMDVDVDFKWGDWVDEYYTVYPDGVCMRTIRAGSDNLEQWLDPNNVVIQNLQLLRGGIGDLPSSWQNPAELSLSGASISNYDNEGFDEMQRCYVLKCRKNAAPSTLDFTLDTAGGKSIHNPAIVVKNWGDAGVAITVDGQAFFDYYTGYTHHFIGSDLVVWLNKESANSIDISISPRGGTAASNRAPQVNAGPYQSIEVTPGTGPYEVDLAGAVDDDGLPNDDLTIIWSEVSGPGSAVFDDANDPQTSVSLSTEGTYKLRLSAYDGQLSGEDDVIIVLDEDPNENERVPVFPVGPPGPGRFGAYYTCLEYSPEWDELWRVGDHVDVVVQFDEFAHRFVFWRGTSYIPCWATDTGGWYTNEFLERRGDQGGCQGCAEPMSDKQCRHGHVRIIQSNDARVVVHWRYPPVDVDYCHPYVDGTGWGDWVDEYYTIYPDAVGVRNAKLYTSAPYDWTEWQEGIVLNQPGTIPEDNLNLEAVSLANMNGESYTYSWEITPPENMDSPAGANIQTINLKGTTRPFQVINHNSAEISAYGGHHPDSHFNWWDHWPVAQERSDGNLASSSNRPSHTSLSHLRWEHYAQDDGIIKSRTKVMLHGMSDEPVAELVPLARSWEIPPVISINSPGFTGGSYDKAQRAYTISRNSEEATTLEFTLQGSSGSPIVNPCFVIENWWGDGSDFRLSIDAQTIEPGPEFRRGIENDANEVSSLVVWIKKDSTSPINITITTSTIIYVDADAPGPVHDGSSWANAYNYLQDALAAAAIYGDEIWVAAGTYTPDPNGLPDPREATFQMINGVAIYGGFAGSEDPCTFDLADRDFVTNETILSGDLNSDDGPGQWQNNGENSYHVVTGSYTDPNAILDGFTITAGNANSVSIPHYHGGGMYNGYSGPTVSNCTFRWNSAAADGGAIADSGGPIINCTIYANEAGDDGGGLKHCSGRITDCIISGNTAGESGGGLYKCSDKITGCTISNNSADKSGGGMYNREVTKPHVTNCILWGNTDAGGAGESAQIWADPCDPCSVPVVNYCCVQGLTGSLGGTGNIGDEPNFVDADGEDNVVGTEDDNLRLRGDSPCIDAGDNTAVPADTADVDGDGDTSEQTPWDLDGLPRFFNDRCTVDTGNPGAPGRPIVDMGAYEFVRSDIGRNGKVNMADLCLVAMRWLDSGCGVCGWADLTCDGKVDLEDFAEFGLTRNQLWAGE